MRAMSDQILDGKALAKTIRNQLRSRLETPADRPPGLAVLMVGDDPASAVYVRNKEKACQKVGIASFGRHFPTETTQGELETAIDALNQDDRVDGILVQLPLPAHLDAIALLHRIRPDKDADGLHPANLGRLVRNEEGLQSCTPAGVMRLLQEYDIDPAGKNAVVIGRSILVGKPLALMLLNANATPTIAHSRTADLAAVTRNADIVVAATGKPGLLTAEMVKPGATVVDVGINKVGDRLVGDVDFDGVREVASFITPVPGGVGPMTVAMLLYNTVWSWEKRMNSGRS